MRNFLVAFGVLAGAGLFLQCTSIDSVCFGEDCGGNDGGPPVPTDACVSHYMTVDCLNDEKGIFVDGSGGNDKNDGTMESPYKTLGQALGKVTTGKNLIYVCGPGPYGEDVVLDASINKAYSGVSLIGGVSCSWATSSDNKPQFNKLTIMSATGVAILNMAFLGPDNTANKTGASSIAAFVSGGEVKLYNVSLTAQTAGDGTSGTFAGPNITPAKGGNKIEGTPSGALTRNDCDCPASKGGAGGVGGDSLDKTNPGSEGEPWCESDGNNGMPICGTDGSYPSNGQGGSPTDNPNTCTFAVGHNGATGLPGNNGIPGASFSGTVTAAFGTLDGTGWTPASSDPGTPGGVGQGGGGGGGAATDSGGLGGGGGGCGGCGGKTGTAAQAGGASVALLSYNSAVNLAGCTLTAGQAGKGGQGASGQNGQPGGSAGTSAGACSGGKGGNGGNGGASAGGAGGVAAGILWQGTAAQTPLRDDFTTAHIASGSYGKAGKGGIPCSAPNCNDGPAGVSDAILQWSP